jgi:hypothetical protein
MSETWERATVNADRPWARAVLSLLRNAPPGSTIDVLNGKPVVRRPRKTIAELRAQMRATASSWRSS